MNMQAHCEKKIYSCQVCGSAFSKGSNLKRHMKKHTGEKPYSCEVCGSTFSRRQNLKRHTQVRNHILVRCVDQHFLIITV